MKKVLVGSRDYIENKINNMFDNNYEVIIEQIDSNLKIDFTEIIIVVLDVLEK